jgi:MoaA/NifB/PqqE/SkfB family radical SAM enzyme
MKDNVFKKVLQNFLPYKDKIEKMSFFNYGEPLVDPKIGPRIGRAKDLGFRGTGISTNATELTKEKSLSLLDAGLDTLICSLDGIKAETHESIRVGADFNEITENILNFIKMRAEHSARTKVVIRFTAQQQNLSEWPEFKKLWLSRLDSTYNDIVFFMRVHNWGKGNEKFDFQDAFNDEKAYPCHDFLTKMYVFADGSVGFCCADCNGDYADLGNASEEDPIEIYNKKMFKEYRDYMRQGRIKELPLCKNCSIPMSRYNIVEYSPGGGVNEFDVGKKFVEDFLKTNSAEISCQGKDCCQV